MLPLSLFSLLLDPWMTKLYSRPTWRLSTPSSLQNHQVYKIGMKSSHQEENEAKRRFYILPSICSLFPNFVFHLRLKQFFIMLLPSWSLLDTSGIVRWSGLETNLTCPRTWDLFHNLSGWPGVCLSHYSEHQFTKNW